jgi:tRNA(fMet)-specific endonuclease VapC
MKAFDTDILTEILRGNSAYADRVAMIPVVEQAIPIVAAEEVLRGRLSTIRHAEAGKAKIAIDRAYHFFEQTLQDVRQLTLLSYTPQAEIRYQEWRQQKLRGSTHDLRIAAICYAHSATLVTRNRRDFEHLQGLSVEFWE